MKARGIVIHDKKLVYWYLPKTGCTTLKHYFAKELGLTVPYRDGSEMDIHGQDIGFIFTENIIPEYFNFAYVRNPYDRIMSLYSQKLYKDVDRNVFPDENIFYSGMPFEEYVNIIVNQEEKERHYMLHSELLPQDVAIYHIENDLFMRILKPLNVSEPLNLWTPYLKEKIYECYEKDFIRFGYSKW